MSTDTGRLRILLVEDEAPLRDAVATLLRYDGHTVECAASGQAALDRLASECAIDLVMTDLGMPGVNGWAVVRAVKTRHPDMPVVLITGWSIDVVEAAREHALVDLVLPKPFDRRSLTAAVAQAAQRTRAA